MTVKETGRQGNKGGQIMLRIVETVDELQSLREEWNRIAELFPSPLLRHEFFVAWLLAGHPDRQPAIFVLHEKGQINAIAPLVRVRRGGVTRLESVGRDISEPFGFLFTDENALRELLRAICKSGYPLHLARIGAGQVEQKVLYTILRWGDLCLRRDGGTGPYLSLQAGGESVEARLSATRRADLRRKRRRAERIGPVAVRALSPTAAEVDMSLDAFFQIEASGWKGRNGSAILSLPEKNRFFRLYGRSLAAEGRLRMFFLSIGGADVAARMAIYYRNRLWELKIGYNETFRDCSPGMLLTYETIKYACQNKMESYEFLGRIAPWNNFWGVQERHHSTIRYYPRGLRSLLCIGSDALLLARRMWMDWGRRRQFLRSRRLIKCCIFLGSTASLAT